jgi:HAD superfamily hydrolase (TIGR01459 family)
MPTTLIDGIAAVADAYALFIVDQWGVLHNGQTAYPGAADALRALKAAGKTVVILSNSGKRPHTSYMRMEELGLGRDLYDEAVTSGGQLYEALKRADAAPYDALGERVHVFAWGDDRGLLEGLPYGEVSQVADADWILCAGAERGSVEAYAEDLRAARRRDLPLLVANPDFVTVAPDGSLQLCPGSLARAYEEMGGTVYWHGKPTPGIYQMCRAVGGDGKAIGIGDSLHHDIAGAAGAGMASLLITQGIHKDELPVPMDAGSIAALAGRYHAPAPDFATPSFRW